jgi:uncharacterized protein
VTAGATRKGPIAVNITVTDVPERSRYEARRGEELLGVLTYHRKAGQIVFDHTGVEPPHRGQGIGALLVAAAMTDAQDDDLRVVPACSFVRRWIDSHPQYLPLV